MCRRSMFRWCGLAAIALVALLSSATAQAQQKSAKGLIAGTWTLLVADNFRSDGTKVPGFGPLPSGTAKFGSDGKYSLQVTPSVSGHPALSCSGSYALDDAGKTLTLHVDQSSLPNWRGTTQNGMIKFVNADNLGWTTSVPFAASVDFTGAELIWARAR
jgi:Lipocalin-like domain